ncbi:MAG TPA: hypothetical protein VLC49_08305 [Solirubrobacteraceae bacterium]|nr:hypothetical protein [Solirubrobacteraceae bacterium]
MITSTCTPISPPTQVLERELRPDHLAGLLGCFADLVIASGQQRLAIESQADRAGESARDAIRRLIALEETLKQLGLEAAAVHQQLQHEHLI